MRKTWKKAAAGMCAAMMALSVANVGPAVMQTEAKTYDGTGNTTGDDAGWYTVAGLDSVKARVSAVFAGTDTTHPYMSAVTITNDDASGNTSGDQVNNFSNALDGDNDTGVLFWHASATSGDYIKLEFKSPINLKSIDFLFIKDCKIPKAKIEYQVKGSDTWQTLREAAAYNADGNNLHFTGEYTASEEGIQMVTAVKLETTQTAGGWGWNTLAEISIDGTAVNLTGELEITSLPNKTVYKVGEALDTAGLVVKKYTSNTEKEAITDYKVSELDNASAGKKTVTITKDEKSVSFDVYVYEPGGFYPQQALTVVAGSEQGSDTDGPISFAFDGNPNTFWHSKYNGNGITGTVTNNLSECWVTMQFEEATVVDGLEYTPRPNNSNGVITGYTIEGSVNGTDYFKLADGTWNGSQNAVQNIEFPAIELKALKFKAEKSKGGNGNEFASAAEINVRTAETEDDFYLGTSLRMDYQDVETEDGETIGFTKTGLRFGYTFPKTLNGMNVSDWDWKYDINDTLTHETNFDGMPNFVEKGDNYVSNLVIGGTNIQNAIGVDKYQKTYYSCISVTYRDEATGLYETICSPVTSDNVYAFAGRAIDLGETAVGEATFAYAQGIKVAWDATQNNN